MTNYIYKEPLKANYSITSNDLAQDNNISGMALATYVYIKSQPSNFKLSASKIAERFKISVQTAWKYINELVSLGVIEVEKARNQNGTFKNFLFFKLLNYASKAISHKRKNSVVVNPPKIGVKTATNPQECEPQSTNEILSTIKRKKNKHENMRACEKISKPNHSLKSPIKNLSAFNQFKNFINSLLGNLDTKGLEPTEKDAFEKFLSYRNEKQKLTYASKKALLEQALELKAQGQNLELCINQSIRRNYNEIYALMSFTKPNKTTSTTHELLQDENFEIKPNPAYGGYCIF
ncbi:HTH domain-containing protein [Helicobacter cetorum]|uniref:HTH domain-containing protein n=1 Tax=Helicobacter cetorum TaxID=138563 RepID=UPI000CF04A5E|nr:HTH domain-containing protein [Helicobacter cetorum]